MDSIAGFPEVFSQLSPVGPQDPARQDAPSGLQAPPEDLADALILSRLRSNTPGSTFGSISRPPERAPAMEPYGPPPVQANRGFSANFSLSYNLSIRREATFAGMTRPEQGGDRAILKALESASLIYQSDRTATQGDLGGSFGEVRKYQTDLFYSRTRELSGRFGPELAQDFEETSRSVARSFEVSISLEASFLTQFTRQSGDISSLDTGLFEQYLSNTRTLSDGPGEGLANFFDRVDGILQNTEDLLVESLGEFFVGVQESFNLSDSETAELQSLVVGEITAFFDDVDQFLADARVALESPAAESALPESEQAADSVEAPESDPELV